MSENYIQELKELAELKNSGAISDDEYSALKDRIITQAIKN